MTNNRIGDVKASSTPKSQPKTKVYILKVGKIVFVKSAHIEEIFPAIHRSGGASAKDFLHIQAMIG